MNADIVQPYFIHQIFQAVTNYNEYLTLHNYYYQILISKDIHDGMPVLATLQVKFSFLTRAIHLCFRLLVQSHYDVEMEV